jgi:hypothetical protein
MPDVQVLVGQIVTIAGYPGRYRLETWGHPIMGRQFRFHLVPEQCPHGTTLGVYCSGCQRAGRGLFAVEDVSPSPQHHPYDWRNHVSCREP